MIKLEYTIPEEHKPFSGVDSVTIQIQEEASVEELVEGFERFMHAIGYSTMVKLDYYTIKEEDPNDRNREQDNDEEEVLRGC